jgi:tetratricopeptide (TPR) repeat protein
METVRDLWIFLRSCGVDARLDRIAAEQPQDWPLWMGDQVREADHILVVASQAYRTRAEGRAPADEGHGVQYEARLIRDAFYRAPHGIARFLPVVLPGQSRDGVPDFLGSNTVYEVREFTIAGAEALVRFLTSQPGEIEPPIGTKPVLSHRDRSLSQPVSEGSPLRHDVALYVESNPDGGVRTRTELAGSVLGEQVGGLPLGVMSCWSGLDDPNAVDRLVALGRRLWDVLLDKVTAGRLLELIDRSPLGSVVNIVVHLSEELTALPVELLRLPDGRLAATVPGVRFTRRLQEIERPATQPLAGPLKILAAVAAPDETATKSAPLDVEAEMQALLDAVTDLDLGSTGQRAQVRILEVASLAEIGKALATDQYHVLHLSAHGSANGVELADEDGNPEPVDTDQLVAALRAGEHSLPLVVLSSCHGASGGPTGLASTLIRHGADRVIAMQTTVTDGFATDLARELYGTLASSPGVTVAQGLATARRIVTERLLTEARHREGASPRPEFAVPTLLAAGDDPPLRDPRLPDTPLERATIPPDGRGVRELPIGQLIGRRAELRTATAVLRASRKDRERVGAWAGVALTGIGGIGKTALAGRILARARGHGWMVAEHVGSWNPPTLFGAVGDALADNGYNDRAAELRDPERDDADKLRIVATMLVKAQLLVLFDDFEQNFSEDFSEFRDPGFADIFQALCAHARAGRLLVTCRYPIPGAEDTLLRIPLPGLSAAELQRLFLRLPALRELSTEDRRLVTRTIGGHPRLIEFLDVLLRHGTASSFQHVTAKLRTLASQEGVDLRPDRPLAAGISEVVRLGSRDILLDALQRQLNAEQREVLLQAALAQAPFATADLVHTQHGADPAPEQIRAVTQDVESLVDLTLLSPSPERELVVHPWVAAALDSQQTGDQLLTRHQRGAAMRLHRLNTGRGRFEDIVELIRHLAGHHDYDTAVAVAFEACDLVGGEVAVSALLADTVPLIPTNHPRFLPLADRECQALLAVGLASATAHRRQALLDITEHRAAADPGNAEYQRDLSVSHEKLGDLAIATGDTTTATQHYQASLTIAERLTAADLGNAEYQRGLSISHNKLGDLAIATGDTTTATQHYQASLTIRQRLAAADPDNAQYQRDLSVSHDNLGDLAIATGDTTTATQHYQASLTIAERLAAADPDNAQYQRDLSISHNKLGNLAIATGDTTTATQHYQASLTIRQRLTAADPDNAQYQRDLSVSHNKLGDLAIATGDTTTATQHYQASLTIRQRLTAADPGNAEYQRDLSVSHDNLGDLAIATGDTTTATQHYQTSLTIAERLTAADPDNAEYQRDLSVSHDNLGDLAIATGDTTTATQHYQTSLTIRQRLTAADPDNAQYQRDLSVSHDNLGDLAIATGDTTTATQHYQTSLTIAERLAAADPDNAQYQRDLSIVRQRLETLTPDTDGE